MLSENGRQRRNATERAPFTICCWPFYHCRVIDLHEGNSRHGNIRKMQDEEPLASSLLRDRSKLLHMPGPSSLVTTTHPAILGCGVYYVAHRLSNSGQVGSLSSNGFLSTLLPIGCKCSANLRDFAYLPAFEDSSYLHILELANMKLSLAVAVSALSISVLTNAKAIDGQLPEALHKISLAD